MEKRMPDNATAAEIAAEKAISAVTDLIAETLKESVSSRFQEAQRLCEVAQNLIRARARRAGDFKAPEPEPMPMMAAGAVNYAVAGNVAYGNVQMVHPPQLGPAREVVDGHLVDRAPGARRVPGRILFDEQGNLLDENGAIWAGHLDTNALMRHMLMAFGPHAQTGAEANRARVAADEATELNALVSLMVGATDPEKSALDRRIKQLMSNLERRSNAKLADSQAAPEVPMVSPDDPRRHPPGEGGAEANPPPGVGANGGGDTGDGGAPPACPLNPVGENALVS